MALKPDFAPAQKNLGLALLKLKRFPEAAEAFRKAVRLNPKDAEARLGLWAAYVHTGEQEEATREFQTLKVLDPELARRWQGAVPE